MSDTLLLIITIVCVGVVNFLLLLCFFDMIHSFIKKLDDNFKSLDLYLKQLCHNTAPTIPGGHVPKPGGFVKKKPLIDKEWEGHIP